MSNGGWQPISTAPRDGTIILVCEMGPEHANVMPAAYINCVGQMEGFWGVWTTSRLPIHLEHERGDAARERGLPVGFREIALTALCWMPLPEPEPIEKLQRRSSQILHHKYKGKL